MLNTDRELYTTTVTQSLTVGTAYTARKGTWALNKGRAPIWVEGEERIAVILAKEEFAHGTTKRAFKVSLSSW